MARVVIPYPVPAGAARPLSRTGPVLSAIRRAFRKAGVRERVHGSAAP